MFCDLPSSAELGRGGGVETFFFFFLIKNGGEKLPSVFLQDST